MSFFQANTVSDYDKFMKQKTAQYDAMICKAETIRRDSGDQPTKKEARCYHDAAVICDEIANMNLGQIAVNKKWKSRAEECREMEEEIQRILAPELFVKQPDISSAVPADGIASSRPPVMNAQPPEDNRQPAAAPSAAPRSSSPKAPPTDGRVAQTTASGFTTYNASKDVPAEVIETWHKAIEPEYDYNNVTGMEKEKALLNKIIENIEYQELNKILGLEEQKCIFFYGLPGTGKTFIIKSFAAELKKLGYDFLQLSGGDVHDPLVGIAEKKVAAAFQEAVDHAPCVIFIDEIEGVCRDRNDPNSAPHERRLLLAFLEAYNTIKNADVVFLGATNYPGRVDTAMMDRIYPVMIPLPSDENRREYFTKTFEPIPLADDLSIDEMVEATDNFNYRDMDKYVFLAKDAYVNQLKGRSAVLGEDGQIDHKKTLQESLKNVSEGNIVLTRELFEEAVKDFVPFDKTDNLESLKNFEKKLEKAKNQGS